MTLIDYKPLANTPGANVETQAQFELDLAPGGTLEVGYIIGTAHSKQFNKVARQSSMMTAAWANLVSEALAIDVIDDGDLPALVILLRDAIAALTTAFTTGDLKTTMKTVADVGWVMCNDGTIGDAVSGATTRANADCEALFTLLWTNVSNDYAPVLPGGHGASAAADWAANKTIGLTKMLGRALAVSGAGAGLTARLLGSTVGEEAHSQTAAELATHTHAINDPGHVHGTPTGGLNSADANLGYAHGVDTVFFGVSNTAAAGTDVTVLGTGAGNPANVMQPTSFVNVMVKL